MALLRTSYMYEGFLEYYFRRQFSAFWSMHDKTSWENANFKIYPSPQKLNYLQKKRLPPPPGHHLKNLEHPDKRLKLLEIS